MKYEVIEAPGVHDDRYYGVIYYPEPLGKQYIGRIMRTFDVDGNWYVSSRKLLEFPLHGFTDVETVNLCCRKAIDVYENLSSNPNPVPTVLESHEYPEVDIKNEK